MGKMLWDSDYHLNLQFQLASSDSTLPGLYWHRGERAPHYCHPGLDVCLIRLPLIPPWLGGVGVPHYCSPCGLHWHCGGGGGGWPSHCCEEVKVMSLYRASPDTILARRQRGTLLLTPWWEWKSWLYTWPLWREYLVISWREWSPVPNSASLTQPWQEWMEIWVPHYRLLRVEVYVHHWTFAGMDKEVPVVLSVVFDWCREFIF